MVCLALTALSLLIAAGLWPMGVAQALPLAMLFYTRHAADRDLIAMKPSLVRVEQHRAGQGRRVVVGEYVPRDCRAQLAEEFRWALRRLEV